MNEIERDPEKMWKQNRNHWNQPLLEDHENSVLEEDNRPYSLLTHFKIQTLLALILFATVLVISSLQHPFASETRNWLKHELHSSLDFVAIAALYDKWFEGSPSFIPRFGNKSELTLAKQSSMGAIAPVADGVLLHSFAELLNGIEIAGAKNAEVRAVEKGRVILVPEKQDSVIIQHANERLSIYNRLGEINVEVSDWVEAGTVIGKLAPIDNEDYSILFLAMKEGNQYIDPLEVITFE